MRVLLNLPLLSCQQGTYEYFSDKERISFEPSTGLLQHAVFDLVPEGAVAGIGIAAAGEDLERGQAGAHAFYG